MFRNLVNLCHLNIEGANSLEEFNCLQTLYNLILGKDNCSGIKEIGPLKHLKGTLRISRLKNVIEPEDAKDTKLIEKTKIIALSLEWSEDIDESKDRTSELKILNGIRPDNDLEELVIYKVLWWHKISNLVNTSFVSSYGFLENRKLLQVHRVAPIQATAIAQNSFNHWACLA